MNKVQVTDEAFRVMVNDAQQAYPEECCGFLFGTENPQRTILRAVPVPNQSNLNRNRRFEISSKDYMFGEAFARKHNLDFIGIYHSHPDHPAIPSEHDRKQALPWFSYAIISVIKGKSKDLKSWRLDAERIFKKELLIKQHKLDNHGNNHDSDATEEVRRQQILR